jgi:hypothetical protein
MDGLGEESAAQRLQQANQKLCEERRALLRALFPPDSMEEIRPEDYPLEVTSIDTFLEDLKDPTKG